VVKFQPRGNTLDLKLELSVSLVGAQSHHQHGKKTPFAAVCTFTDIAIKWTTIGPSLFPDVLLVALAQADRCARPKSTHERGSEIWTLRPKLDDSAPGVFSWAFWKL
jgi:hypothetical protein